MAFSTETVDGNIFLLPVYFTAVCQFVFRKMRCKLRNPVNHVLYGSLIRKTVFKNGIHKVAGQIEVAHLFDAFINEFQKVFARMLPHL